MILEEYLGDGAYVSLNDYGEVNIYTSDGISRTNNVVLEYYECKILLSFLNEFIKRVEEQIK